MNHGHGPSGTLAGATAVPTMSEEARQSRWPHKINDMESQMSRKFPQALVLIVLGFIILAMPQHSFTSTAPQSPWPGQPGNPVGHTAWSGWTGSFNTTPCGARSSGTSWANATVVQNCTYSTAQTISCNYCEFIGVDFNAGAGVTQVNGNHIMFIGCRFQSNDVAGGNVGAPTSFVYFFYDSFTPLASLSTSPPGYTWPSAGAGANSTTISSGANAINGNDGYEYGINLISSSGNVWIDHCDFWGFGDAIVLPSGSSGQITITNNQMHDIADPSIQGYHTDGPGYSNGATGPSNVTIIGNTIAMLGNTNALALQAATGGYQNIYVASNFWSGDNATISWCHPGSVQCTNSYFYANTFGTDVKDFGAIYSPGASIGSGSAWACNTIEVRSGTTWTNNDGWTPTSAMNGQYFVDNFPPNSTTDQGSNTLCGVPAPSSINFGNQAMNSSSGEQTITLSSTNTGNLSISSIALATGTQFSISSNTCGSTLSSGSNCSITVKFSPTSMGPQVDTLLIADNTPGVSSPQLVPLVGIGTPASLVAPPTGLSAVVQ